MTNRPITGGIVGRWRRGEICVQLDFLGEAGWSAARELRVLDVLDEHPLGVGASVARC